jgi:hypothetical protein
VVAHGRSRTVQPVAGGRVRGDGATLLAGLPWPQPARSRCASGEIKEKADGGGREGRERGCCEWEDWGWLGIGLAARHGRVLQQLPGFAVPAATLWRPGVPRGAVAVGLAFSRPGCRADVALGRCVVV